MFEDMQAWEEEMFAELHQFFGIEISPETGYLLTKDFSQGVVHNKDARILYFDEGGIAMMYIYADEESAVITNSEEAIKEIILRLSGSRIKK